MPTTILIADDNPAVRLALCHLLESAGPWEIIAVENGQEAIARAQQLRPNLISLDLVMPVMDGLAAARELSKTLPDIPLLMHTLHWSPQVEIEAQKVGVKKVVPKEDSKGLISAIYQLLAAEPPAPQPLDIEIPPSLSSPEITALPPVADSGTPAASDQPDKPSLASTDDIPKNPPLP